LLVIALLLRAGGEHPLSSLGSIGRAERSAFFIRFADVIEDPLLLQGNVWRVRVDNIKGPFTFRHLRAQLAIKLFLCQRSNVNHALLVRAMSVFTAAFGRLRVEDGVAYVLSILDHVAEAMLDMSTQVCLPLFIGLNETSVCANGWWRWWRCWR